MKRLVALMLVVMMAFALTLNVCAQEMPITNTFTHHTLPNGSTKAVAMRPVYKATQKINARALGLDETFGNIVQIKCDQSGNVYILTENSEIIRLSSSFEYIDAMSISDRSGNKLDFSGSSGLFVTENGELYIADTGNSRVLKCVGGVLEKEIFVPESALIPSDFIFQPTRVAIDTKGYLYVLSEGSYYGIVLYDPEGEFVGFYGANTVKGTVLTTLQHVWDTLTKNDIKRAKEVKKLPYQIIDLCIDKDDFVYTCTGKNAGGAVGQIRMLSPGGSNIMNGAESKNFGEINRIRRREQNINQNFSSIATDEYGYIYALDSTYGFVYIYDNKSNLLAAFGGGIGNGDQLGVFKNASSIAFSGSKLLVSDSTENSITVFEATEFGELLFKAQKMSLSSDHLGAEPIWQSVYELDEFNHLAMVGLAKAAYDRGDYSASMKYSELSGDSETYSQALKHVQNAFITKNWTWIFILSLGIIISLSVLVVISIKRRIVIIKNEKLRLMCSAVAHPFASFSEIKYKKKGSLLIATVLTLLYFVVSVLCVTKSNFRYTTFDTETFNSLMQLARTVGLVALWTVSNWAVSILFHGRGTMKEVYTVTAYSLFPLIIANVLVLPISHMIASGNSALISGITTVATVLAGIMLCVGHMTVHDFSLPRFLATAALTVVFMILIVFVLFMICILISQFWNFAVSIFLEAVRW